MTALVLDASVTICWAFSDEASALANEALDAAHTRGAMVPALWWFEIRNALLMNERRNRIADAETEAFLGRIARMAIVTDRSTRGFDLMALSRKHRLTVYDAAYLELAIREHAALASLDTELTRAARAEGVAVLGA